MTLGEKIHELRKAHKMSQERMAELLSVSRQAVSKWETGQSNPNTENLICLAEIFDVSVGELTNPDTKVELVFDLREEINRMRESSKKFKVLIISCLILFAGTFAAALYTRFNGYSESLVLLLVILSAAFMLSAFLPIIIMILRYVYQDCKRRGIKPTFYVLISFSVAGLAYYILRRDYLTQMGNEKK